MTEEALRGLSRERMEELTVCVLREAWGARPEVRLIELEGRRIVVKDYAGSATLSKRLVGAFLVRREAAALRRAEGMRNIPRVLARLGACALMEEYIPSEQITNLDEPELDREFFKRLTEMVRELHRRGVAHGDLEKLDNILITPEGEPALVDFAAAILGGGNPLAALALPYVQQSDFRGIYKLKERYAPDLLSEAERKFLHNRPQAERVFRRLRVYVRNPVKALSGTDPEQTRGTDE